MDKEKTKFIPPKNKNDLTTLLAGLIKDKKVIVAIDSANLYFATNAANIRMDYEQIKHWFATKCDLVSFNYYTAFDPEDKKQEEFLVDLEQNLNYKIIKKPIKIYDNQTKGNMDIELAVDAIMAKENYEVLILISGDGDFTYLINALENEGKKVIVLGIGGFTSYELHQRASNYFFLNRISQVWRKPGRRTSTNVADKLDNNQVIDDKIKTSKIPNSRAAKPNKEVDSSTNSSKPVSKEKLEDKDKSDRKIKKPPVRLRIKTPIANQAEPQIFM